MLEISSLTYRIAGRTLFDAAGAFVPAGHHVGLVGRNGSGKSTLLRLIQGELEPDGGAIRLPRGTTIGMLAQEAPGGETTPLATVLAGDRRRAALLAEADTAADPHRIAEIHTELADIEAHAAPARAATILAGLGFDQAAQERPLASFSGGWRMRVALAAQLFAQPDLLLLDEPTNHLDFEAAAWLEGFLKRYPRTFLLVSHDRDFLDEVADGILHLEQGKLTFYRGNYARFQRTRRERLAYVEALAVKREAERKHIQAFIDRFRAKATKARQAQSRIKALARLEPIEIAARDEAVRFQFPDPDELAPPLIALDRAAVGYGGAPVLQRLDLRVDPDDRIALLGANGNGKTTLVRLLAGRLPTMSGTRVASSRLRVGYFAQHQIDELDPDATPYLELQRRMPEARVDQVRARLGRFGFGQARAEVPVTGLSGGEKARLTLALITHDAPHLLVLDEPTNHLDLEARDALIEGLADYGGAVIVVTHDRHLVELIAERLWLVADGTATPFDGDIDDYRRMIAETPRAAPAPSAPPTPPRIERVAKALPATAPARPNRPVSSIRRAAQAAETLVAKLTDEKAALDRDLADPETYRNGGERLAALTRRHAHAARELAEAEARWLELAQQLEDATRAS
ncbi:MAG TPA: ABC-F family ATP-binding cassette domain-containing protein [Candidatus Sulfotelmatobacter sp.]|nr:ABC-F family ATP-binding cassette domain-containing protein [Candidatus Sulfotelmatobacter sp.]